MSCLFSFCGTALHRKNTERIAPFLQLFDKGRLFYLVGGRGWGRGCDWISPTQTYNLAARLTRQTLLEGSEESMSCAHLCVFFFPKAEQI